jgi:hypothetical protein
MQLLLAISMLSFVAVLWAAIAFARHIKASRIQDKSVAPQQQPTFKHHLLSIREPVFQPEAPPPRIRQTSLNQSVRDITANKQWSLPPQPNRLQRLPLRRPEAADSASARPPSTQPSSTTPSKSTRKPPQAARNGRLTLLDPAYFNKDMGDLTDPYEPPRVRSNDRNRSDSFHY